MQAQAPPKERSQVTKTIEEIKEWILQKIKIAQKPQLDEKIKELEQARLQKITISLNKGVGKSIGKQLTGARKIGLNLTRRLRLI
ncbi:Uncharacterised protein [uncultured archaeon]|nr:Uncharacterised protein [uncultured archaeon]